MKNIKQYIKDGWLGEILVEIYEDELVIEELKERRNRLEEARTKVQQELDNVYRALDIIGRHKRDHESNLATERTKAFLASEESKTNKWTPQGWTVNQAEWEANKDAEYRKLRAVDIGPDNVICVQDYYMINEGLITLQEAVRAHNNYHMPKEDVPLEERLVVGVHKQEERDTKPTLNVNNMVFTDEVDPSLTVTPVTDNSFFGTRDLNG